MALFLSTSYASLFDEFHNTGDDTVDVVADDRLDRAIDLTASAHVIAGGADESTVGVVIDIMSCTEDTRKLLAYVVIQLDVTAKAGAGRC